MSCHSYRLIPTLLPGDLLAVVDQLKLKLGADAVTFGLKAGELSLTDFQLGLLLVGMSCQSFRPVDEWNRLLHLILIFFRHSLAISQQSIKTHSEAGCMIVLKSEIYLLHI